MVVGNEKQMLPSILTSLREREKLPQREVSYALGIDTTTYCKIEKGKYPANKEQVEKLAELLHAERNELVKVWLADKIINIANKDKTVAADAIKLADREFNDLCKEL